MSEPSTSSLASTDAAPAGRRRRRALSPAQRALGAVLGAGSGAIAGLGIIVLTDWDTAPLPIMLGTLALLGAGLGLRYGARVVRAMAAAFVEASD